MDVFSRIVAFIIMSIALELLIAVPLVSLVIARMTASRELSGEFAAVAAAVIIIGVLVLTMILGFSAPTPRSGWTRLLGIASIAAFVLPIDALIFGAAASGGPHGETAAAIGVGVMAAAPLGFLGLFLGLGFGLAALLTRE